MIQLRAVEPQEYRTLYDHMKRDFPRNERPPYFAVRGSLTRGVYGAVYLLDQDKVIGYAVVTAPGDSQFALINFLAILPDRRSNGYGSRLIALLAERYQDRTLVLEVESPDAAKDGQERLQRQRRVRFYERAGFFVVPTERCKIFGVDMWIMMNKSAGGVSVRGIMRAMYLPAFGHERWLGNIDVIDKA